MALKKINENPKITDTILIEIETPGVDGCFSNNPYKVDSLTIYYVERDFMGDNFGEYSSEVVNDNLKLKLKKAEDEFCGNPNLDNLNKLEKIKTEIYSATQRNTFYYKDRSIVKQVGSSSFPAWLSTDADNAYLQLKENEYGKFYYEWDPKGHAREGDYFVCWTWTPIPDGEKLSAHLHFFVEGDGAAVSATPAHVTPNDKYETLLERYLPEVYKYTLSNNDITPQVTERLNQSVAKGFTFLEDMANQLIDLFDANALHESLLNYLSNLFAVRLRSSDPTLWRRQIKEAIPLFKKKGTLDGLKQAFTQSGMVLNSYVQYWQITSPYTWIQVFKVKDSVSFILEKDNIVSFNSQNFKLWLKREGQEYTEVSFDNVSFSSGEDGLIRMTWVGDQLSTNRLDLYENDKIKLQYQYHPINSNNEQNIENYIQMLPLMDQRNEDDQDYPPKNWNVKLIAEDDPMFSVLIPVRHPFADPLQFGWVRTEFAYSENVYNAEEYNGSTRPSFDACRIDKEFIDPCRSCLSSSYSLDVGIEELSNDRILEAQDIVREYVPFHAQLYSIGFTGEVNEFVQSPVEKIETLVTLDYSQFILSGNSNPFFTRNLEKGSSNYLITRENLTDQVTVLSGKVGVAYNDHIKIIIPDYRLKSLGLNVQNHILEILSPSANVGTYTIDEIEGNTARVTSYVNEPLDKTAFTFNLSNIVYGNTNSSIFQKDLVKLNDFKNDITKHSIKTLWHKKFDDYEGEVYKILIPSYSNVAFDIEQILDGHIIIKNDSFIFSNATNINYSIIDDLGEMVSSSNFGNLFVEKRGLVNFNDSAILNINDFVKIGDFLYYNQQEFVISEISGNNFYIKNYSSGDAVGVSVHSRRRLIINGVGFFGYKGLNLKTQFDHESEFEMMNGKNKPNDENEILQENSFIQNFMFKIGEEFYKITSINKTDVVLNGREQDWTTLNFGGEPVDYSIVRFPKKQINVGFTVFSGLDRSGYDPVIREIESEIDQNTATVALSMPKSSGFQESISNGENIFVTIESKNGEKTEGEL